MDLVILRHGQSEADLLGVHEGRADFSLTALGETQAAQAAKWINMHFPIDAIFASPLRRTKRTAEHLSAATNISVIFDDDLMEWQNGLLAGLTFAEAGAKYPAPDPRHPHTALYGCESMIAFRARVETALSRIISAHSDKSCIAIVTHGGTINMLLRAFLRLPLTDDVFLHTGDTGIHHWRIAGTRRDVILANSLAHLK